MYLAYFLASASCRFTAKDPWDKVRELIADDPDFKDIETEEERQRLFEKFVASDPWSRKSEVS